jgi:hypothetical protein
MYTDRISDKKPCVLSPILNGISAVSQHCSVALEGFQKFLIP